MRIRRMYLNGFGIHRERTFELDPEAPAALFYGRNEAGKSTIIGFIRAMLFGFPTRANMPERYEPLAGGVHGGILTVCDEAGREIRIERYEKNGSLKLIFPDGSEGGTAALHALLGGITPDLYRNLFAFSLSELQKLETLQQDEVGSFLFSAGMGVSGSAIVQTERKLAARMDELYKPRGSKQEINKLLKELEAIEAELKRSKETSAGYRAGQEELSRLDGEIAAAEEELEQLLQQREWLNKCVQARPAWVRLLEIERRLGELPSFERFPENAVERLEALLAEKARIEREWGELAAGRAALEQKLEEARPNELLIGLGPELEQLLDAAPVYSDGKIRAADLQSELSHARDQLAHHLRQIDPDWTEEELERFPMTVSHRDEVRRYAEQFAELASRKLAGDTELERLTRRGAALKEALEERRRGEEEARRRADAELAPLLLRLAGASADEFEARLRRAWDAAGRAAEEVMHIRQRLEELGESEALLSGTGKEKRAADADAGRAGGASRPKRGGLSAAIAAAMMALNALLPLWLWLGADRALEAAVLFAALGVANAAWLPRLLRFGAANASGNRFDTVRQSYAARRAELERELADALRHWRLRREELQRLMEPAGTAAAEAAAEAAAASAMPGAKREAAGRAEPDADPKAWLAGMEAAVESVFAGLQRLRRYEAELALAREQSGAAERAVADWQKEWEAAMQDRERLEEEEAGLRARWQEWLRGCRLPERLAPETVTAIFHHAEQGLDWLRRAEKVGKQLEAIRDRVAEFEQSAAAFIRKIKNPAADAADAGKAEGESFAAAETAAEKREAGMAAAESTHAEHNEGMAARFAAERLPAFGGDLIYELKNLKNAWEEQVRLKEAVRHWTEQRDDLKLREAAAGAQLAKVREALEQLLQDAQAADEEEFRRLARLYAERAALTEEKHRQEIAIFTWVKAEDRERLFQTLENYDSDQLEQRLQEQDEAIAAKREQLNEGKDRRGRLRAELDMLSSGEKHGELLQRHQELIAAFEQLTSRYAELALCAELIRRAREIYERERQPGVLQRASAYFRLITGGRYVRVVSRIGEKAIYVENENGEQISSAFLSRGTAEQLYLAMRFALAGEYAKTAALPIVMDDIFVNFDAERLQRSLQMVAEVTRQHQIILFTCHAHVAEAMEAAVPRLQRIDLHS